MPTDPSKEIEWVKQEFSAGRLDAYTGPDPIPEILKADGVANYWNYGVPAERYPFDTRRLRRVLETAAERSGWSKRPRAVMSWR